MGKTIADRLREYKMGDGWICWGQFFAEIMGYDEHSCPEDTGGRITCYVCYESQLRKLADAIEVENIEFRTMGFLEGLRGHDTQEDIDYDAELFAATLDADDEERFRSLLERQRKLLGGE